ncbi:probable pectinesterase/pectinesterase inhibitor 12 [Malania oleifera]|uniref:probable pectinesterase/pectinesterase inhibitor 12 n=1 Tax=Malania oleifera TaxID=397392 RepID=UPI0025ADB7D1|nr:probable pectinesterase/pectinesterase inhibitor 12 [Malania oleifera]
MAVASITRLAFLLLLIFLSRTTWALNTSSSASLDSHLRSFCHSAPYPEVCFDSLKLSITISFNPNILTYLLQSLHVALSEAGKLADVLAKAGQRSNIIEKQEGALQDCNELHQITLSSLQKSASWVRSSPNAESRKLADARAFLSAALTNKNTCLEGLDSASGTFNPTLLNSVISTYRHVSNCLSILSRLSTPERRPNRRLLGVPKWVLRKHGRVLHISSLEQYDASSVLLVAKDGTGNFTKITDAINFAPNNSVHRVIVYIKQGVYDENVEIPSYKPNIVLLGDGTNLTLITSNRSVVDGWTTFRSATVAVSGDGFLARDISFENRAGAEKHQAVALRVNADLAAVYRCAINGYQDTLYVHSFRQFYRECDIYGTVDFIFGNAAVVFQACNLVVKMPLRGQYAVVTAQSRDSEYEDTGISVQNCSVVAASELYNVKATNRVRSYLGRPWREYSRTVFMESYIDELIDPTGWVEWPGVDEGRLETLYYGEYENDGPGSGTENRVRWSGYHVMDYDDASNFSVSNFIAGDDWLESTLFPFDD